MGRTGSVPSREDLRWAYIDSGLEPARIAEILKCSERKVWYWLDRYEIHRGPLKVSRAEALALQEAIRRTIAGGCSKEMKKTLEGLLTRL